MSHVAEVALEVKDLDALKAACERLGTVEFVEGQRTYKWYGHHVGDYPIPKGFTVADLGHCDHAIRVKGKRGAYEVGVVARGGRYHLLWDFYAGGRGLVEAIGSDGGKLKQAYGVEAAKRAARRRGFRIVREREIVLPNGQRRIALQVQR